MKKLLTIICALSLIMAFSVPAMALDDIEDNNAGVTLGSPLADTNQATDDSYVVQDNDGMDVDTGDIASGNDNDGTDVDVTTGDLLSNNDSNDDNSNWQQDNSDNSNHDNPIATDSFKSEDNDGTDVDVAFDDIKLKDIANDKSDDDVVDNKDGQMDNDLVDQDNTDNDLVDQDNTDNDLVDMDGDNDGIDQDNTDNDLADNDMNDNMAAAAMGGFAIGISIDDIELNLAQTTSYSGIVQTSVFGAGAANLGFFTDDAEVNYEGSCNSIDASVYSNTGVTGATFTSGNFNNSANLNSVTMTVQY